MDLANPPAGCTDPVLIERGLLAVLHPGHTARDRVTGREVVSREFLGIWMWMHSTLAGRIESLKELHA